VTRDIHARALDRLAVARRASETIAVLVAATGLSRRAVQEALREPAYDPPQDVTRELTAATVAGWQARLPPPDRDLDHVAATADTVLRRARFLHETYWLDGAHLVCVGDRDLTSLAVATVCPGLRVSVVDVDEGVLAAIRSIARESALNVQTAFADLRIGPPASLLESGDLAFTDPPYTPEGVQLFAARALQMLRHDDAARVLVCYGHGESQPALGYGVQEALHELRLLTEALYPGFNHYAGAEAIGSRSSLYVTRPTRRTWAAAEKKGRSSARIYSGGNASLESRASVVGPDAGRRLDELARALPEDARRILRGIAERPNSKLGNAWREALIAESPMTKNEARELIAQHPETADLLERRLTELPRDALDYLLRALSG
jgi:hypothetical protein